MSDEAKGAGACPICGRPTVPALRPFCSRRCADLVLSRWLGGVYRIEGRDSPASGGRNEDDEDAGGGEGTP